MTLRPLPLCLAAALPVVAAAPAAAPRPNVILILTDDLGYGDLGCYGSKIPTPNLDQMAREGVRFTDFHASQAVCSASRASLMTGCYSNRVGIHWALDHSNTHGLDPRETTLPSMFKAQGYATAMVGKWHLGHLQPFLPTAHGFDQFFGLPYSHDMWPGHPENPKYYKPLPLYEGDRIIDGEITADEQPELMERFTARAEAVVRTPRDRPFFLYLAYHAPHVPCFPGKAWQGKTGQGTYADTVAEIDAGVGRVLKALRETGQDRNTLVLFASDNGPWLAYGNHAGSAGPYREGKGTSWNGGTGVPLLVRWPGHVRPGAVVREPAVNIDLLPTLAAYAGAPLPAAKIDGRDIRPLLEGRLGAKADSRPYFFYYGSNELQAVRSGDWKLVFPHAYRSMQGQTPGADGKPGRYRQLNVQAPELYQVRRDPSERRDLARRHPALVKRLQAAAEQIRAELGDGLQKRQGTEVRPPRKAEDFQR